jgi:DNA polymerase-1
MAMLAVGNDPELKRLDARLLLQIHDELLLEAPEANAEQAGKRLVALMSEVKPGGEYLEAPLAVEWGAGRSWDEAH